MTFDPKEHEHKCISGARKTIPERDCLACQRAKAARLADAIDGKQGWAAEYEKMRLEVERLQAIVDVGEEMAGHITQPIALSMPDHHPSRPDAAGVDATDGENAGRYAARCRRGSRGAKRMTTQKDEHTPGPWEIGGPYPSVSVIMCVDGGQPTGWTPAEPPVYEPVASLFNAIGPNGEQWEQTQEQRTETLANATLMAAAPDLLRACRMAVQALSGCNEAIAEPIRRAIRLAEKPYGSPIDNKNGGNG